MPLAPSNGPTRWVCPKATAATTWKRKETQFLTRRGAKNCMSSILVKACKNIIQSFRSWQYVRVTSVTSICSVFITDQNRKHHFARSLLISYMTWIRILCVLISTDWLLLLNIISAGNVTPRKLIGGFLTIQVVYNIAPCQLVRDQAAFFEGWLWHGVTILRNVCVYQSTWCSMQNTTVFCSTAVRTSNGSDSFLFPTVEYTCMANRNIVVM